MEANAGRPNALSGRTRRAILLAGAFLLSIASLSAAGCGEGGSAGSLSLLNASYDDPREAGTAMLAKL